jgi:hypothetical protein
MRPRCGAGCAPRRYCSPAPPQGRRGRTNSRQQRRPRGRKEQGRKLSAEPTARLLRHWRVGEQRPAAARVGGTGSGSTPSVSAQKPLRPQCDACLRLTKYISSRKVRLRIGAADWLQDQGNDIPTLFQRTYQRLPTGCVFHPPYPPCPLEGVRGRWKRPPLPTDLSRTKKEVRTGCPACRTQGCAAWHPVKNASSAAAAVTCS